MVVTEPSIQDAPSGKKAAQPTANATTGTATKKYSSSKSAVDITVAKLRPHDSPFRCKMNAATALPPTTEGVNAEANSQSRMLDVARLRPSWPRASTFKRITYPTSRSTTSASATTTHVQATLTEVNARQVAPSTTDHRMTPTEARTATVTVLHTRRVVSHLEAETR